MWDYFAKEREAATIAERLRLVNAAVEREAIREAARAECAASNEPAPETESV